MFVWLKTSGLGLTRINESGLAIVLWIAILLEDVAICQVRAAIKPVSGQCDEQTEFTCVNGNCIPLEKVNNTVNDCFDNSDEVAFPCKSPGFSCFNGNCPPSVWYLDGQDDCGDGTDEAKIIGQNCSMVKRDWSTGEVIGCCDCDDYVPNSECVRNGSSITCQCKSGFYSNDLGTNCIRRAIGDLCSLDADCYDAFPNSSCVDQSCLCDVGYYNSEDGSRCIARSIGDTCAVDVDCWTVVAHSNCTRDQCMCDSGYYQSDDLTTCILREIGQLCTEDHECHGVSNSICVDGHCTCARGYKNDLGPRVCNMRRIGEPCVGDPDCPVVGSACANQTCRCRLGRYPTEDGRFCPLRVVGDACAVDRDCNASFAHSYCAESSAGVRTCRCDVGYHGPNRATRCFPTYSNGDVLLFVINVFLIAVLVLIIIWLILYFRQVYAEKVEKIKKLREKQMDYWVAPFEDGEIHANSH